MKGLISIGLGKRLIFGTDQVVWPDASGLAIEGIQSASFLREDQKRDIFYNNAELGPDALDAYVDTVRDEFSIND